MNSPELTMALSFGLEHPDMFARVLEHHDPSQTAIFLDRYGSQLPENIVERLLPHHLSQICEHLDAKSISRIVSMSDASFIAAVLRNLTKAKRNSVLGYLSATHRAACQLLLNFPVDAVGSWMNTTVIALPADASIVSAKKLVEKGEDLLGSDRIFVVDRNRALIGYVSYLQLNRADKKLDFYTLIKRDTDALLSRMTIETALQHASWAHVDILPVVNRNQSFVGAIRHVDLRVGLDQLKRMPDMPTDENALNSLAEAFGSTYLTLFNTLEELIVNKNRSGGA